MIPIVLVVLGGGTVYALVEKHHNPSWTPFSTLFATPRKLREALDRVRITSVPTPATTTALDPGMSSHQVAHVNAVLQLETDPKTIHDHATAAAKVGLSNTSKALTAKAEAVGQAKAAGATDADLHKEQLAAATPAATLAAKLSEPMTVCEAETLLNVLARRQGVTNVDGVAMPLPITNAMSDDLIHCIKLFQNEVRLAPTGNLDETTSAELRAEVTGQRLQPQLVPVPFPVTPALAAAIDPEVLYAMDPEGSYYATSGLSDITPMGMFVPPLGVYQALQPSQPPPFPPHAGDVRARHIESTAATRAYIYDGEAAALDNEGITAANSQRWIALLQQMLLGGDPRVKHALKTIGGFSVNQSFPDRAQVASLILRAIDQFIAAHPTVSMIMTGYNGFGRGREHGFGGGGRFEHRGFGDRFERRGFGFEQPQPFGFPHHRRHIEEEEIAAPFPPQPAYMPELPPPTFSPHPHHRHHHHRDEFAGYAPRFERRVERRFERPWGQPVTVVEQPAMVDPGIIDPAMVDAVVPPVVTEVVRPEWRPELRGGWRRGAWRR